MASLIKIIKNRSDIGAGTRGSDLGIDAIEIAAINQNNDYFNQFPFEDIKSHNESIYDKDRNTFAKRIEHVVEQCTRVSYTVKKNLEAQFFPIILSGDHSSALGTISGIKTVYPKNTLGVIWIDAHADLHSPYTSPSGNIHGMPLAAAIADDNLSCQINELTPETQQHWEELKNIGCNGSKILAKNIVYFGLRDTQNAENKQIEKYAIRNYKVDEIRFRGLKKCVDEAMDKLSNCDILYISFDVDSMDCHLISYGTGTPVPRGFDQYEIIEIIDIIIETKKVVCIEFVEINPLLDNRGNKMAETAFEVLDHITSTILLPRD